MGAVETPVMPSAAATSVVNAKLSSVCTRLREKINCESLIQVRDKFCVRPMVADWPRVATSLSKSENDWKA